MSYFFLFTAAFMWSFVGVLVKTASQNFDSGIITLSRFLFGCCFLVIFLKIKKIPIRLLWNDKWIWVGMIGKSLNYILENIGITLGFAYGNIIINPVQAIFLTFVAVWVFNEKMNIQKLIAIFLCLLGVFFVGWKGVPLADLLGKNLLIIILYIFASIGAGCHLLSQKKLSAYVDSGNQNLSTFLFATFLVMLPLPFTFNVTGKINPLAIASLLGLGLITGISFYLYAEGLKKVPFLIASIITNSCVLFSLLWSWLFLKEEINLYVIIGSLMLLLGLVIINLPDKMVKKIIGIHFKEVSI